MALKLMSSGGGSVTLDVPSTASNLTMTVPAAAGSVPYVDTSGILQGITSGIKFPATQVGSSDANVLDDYEEGSWSPVVNFTASGLSNNATYIKIGKLVLLTFYLQGARTNAPGVDFQITGLPYAIAVGPDVGSTIMLPYNVSTPYALGAIRRYNDTSLGILSSATGTAWGWTSTNAFSTGLYAVSAQFAYYAA